MARGEMLIWMYSPILAQRSISSIAAAVSSWLTRIEAFRRGSRCVQCASCHSLMARWIAAPTFEILLREDEEIEHLQDAELDVVGIEMLLLHEGEIGAGHAAGRRPGVAPRDQRRGARIGRGADIGRAQMVAVGLQMLLPAFRQELVEVGARTQARMDVAIDDAQPAVGGGFSFRACGRSMTSLMRSSLDVVSCARASAAERFPADCRRTCATRCLRQMRRDRDRRRRTASADNRTRTGTSCRSRSGR